MRQPLNLHDVTLVIFALRVGIRLGRACIAPLALRLRKKLMAWGIGKLVATQGTAHLLAYWKLVRTVVRLLRGW